MSKEFDQLQAFTQRLAKTGMNASDISVRSYEYALQIYQDKEEMQIPQGAELPPHRKLYIMDLAANLSRDVMKPILKEVFERGGTGWKGSDDSPDPR